MRIDPVRISPGWFRLIATGSLWALCVIVVTGAAVRLSGSGLGCADWPRCNAQEFVDVSTPHAAIEQINRLFTGVVAVAVIVAVLAAYRRVPRRRDLTRLAVLIALGIPAQAVVGGIVVLSDLHPAANQLHFVLSMALVAMGLVLVRRAQRPDGADGSSAAALTARTIMMLRAISVASGVAVLTGTVVTGSGPHAGDEKARRFDIAIRTAARVHSVTVLVAIGIAIAVGVRLWRSADRVVVERAVAIWMAVACGQAVLGYVQYFSGVPAVLVAIHVAVATGFWLASVDLWLCTTGPVRRPGSAAKRVGDRPADLAHRLVAQDSHVPGER